MSEPFQFRFGSLIVPSHEDDSKQPPHRFSYPAPNMTLNDHQLLGDWIGENDIIKITYNHTKLGQGIYEHQLVNPFVIRIGQGTSTYFLIRETPSKLYRLSYFLPVTEYQRKGVQLEQKSNFAFNSIRNIFEDLICTNGHKVLRFRTTEDKYVLHSKTTHHQEVTETFELINPLTCHCANKWFFVDIRNRILHELVILPQTMETNSYELAKMDDQTLVLLTASEFYLSY